MKSKMKSDYLKQIDEGLIINQQFMIRWSNTPEQLIDLFKSNIQKVGDNYYTLSASLFNDRYVGKVGIHYSSKGTITKVELYKDQNSDLQKAFPENQKILEEYFKKPSKISLGLFSVLKTERNEKEYKWHFKHVTLTHSLRDRFSIEERIEFLVKLKE